VSGHGAPDLKIVDGADRLRVAIVASLWHTEVMDGLLGGARRALSDNGVREAIELRVPGAFELSVAAARLAGSGKVDVIVALGVVVRGGTPHFDFVCQAAATGLTLVSQRTGMPIGFGVLTCDTEEQALDRAGLPGSTEDKGYEAAVAALATAVTLAPYSSC
jgi:6,7-dimethyl-8-ribityllumazine synthase